MSNTYKFAENEEKPGYTFKQKKKLSKCEISKEIAKVFQKVLILETSTKY